MGLKMGRNLLLFVFVTMWISGCASVNSLSITSIPAKRTNQVYAEKSKMIFLGFNFSNDYVEELVEDLQSQCPRGTVSGILTKDENYMYFLFFLTKRKVSAKGFCNQSVSARGRSRKNRGTASEPTTSPTQENGSTETEIEEGS
ncbi:MAG: hypothetical protein KDD22_07410 [Bdellovibrionales bacterium]|nr:hypothetical protein [Bdellovibrionales bacterium]